MKAILEKIENSEAYFEFIIEAEKFEHALEKSYKKNVNKFDIPSFSKEKVSRFVLESKLRPEVLYQDALDFVVPKEYDASLKVLELKPIGDPDIEVEYIERGKPLTVKVNVPVMPEVTLGKLEGFEIKVPKVHEITEEDIEKYLNEQFAQEIGKVKNLEELRLKARKELAAMVSLRATNTLKHAIIKAMLETCDASVPEFLIMKRAKAMFEQLTGELESQGGSIDLYLQMTNGNNANLKKRIWEDAENAMKTEYILGKIIKEKNFEVSEEELTQGTEDFAAHLGMDKANARENLGPLLEKVLFELKADKAIQYMVDHAVITTAQ